MSHRNYGVEDVGRGGRCPRRDGVDVCRLVCESVRFEHGFMTRWAASERLSARHLRQLIPPTHQGQTGAEAPSRSRKERKPSGVVLDWTVRNVIGDRTSVP